MMYCRSGKEGIGICVAMTRGKGIRPPQYADHVQDGPKSSGGFYWVVTQLIGEYAKTPEKRRKWERWATQKDGEELLATDPDFVALEAELERRGLLRRLQKSEPPPVEHITWPDLNDEETYTTFREGKGGD